MTRPHACVVCQQRKVKCDKKDPYCSRCVQAGVDCQYRDPAPPKRKRKKGPEELLVDMGERVRYLEGVLTKSGITLDEGNSETDHGINQPLHNDAVGEVDHLQSHSILPSRKSASGSGPVVPDSPPAAPSESSIPETGRGDVKEGRPVFFESNIWMHLKDEVRTFQNPEEDRVESRPQNLAGDASVLLLSTPSDAKLRHPSASQVSKLWQVFLKNVNPLCKLIHVPTMEKEIFRAGADPGNISKSMEALMFTIYLAAVNSIVSDEECQRMFGEPRDALMAKYLDGSRQSLMNANLLRSSELMVLQAFELFLLCVREVYDARSLWALSGVAVRLGHRIGLHRDGTALGLDPFETELRRRLCWQVLVFDSRIADVAGVSWPIQPEIYSTKVPLNINDSDIYPGMRDPPKERTGPTEMMFCLIRYTFGETIKRSAKRWNMHDNEHFSPEESTKKMDELEELVETKFLRYCDPLNRLHILSSIMARTAISRWRFRFHRSRYLAADKTRQPSEEEKATAFTNSLRIIEYDNVAYDMAFILKGFEWHAQHHFAWEPFICILSHLWRHTRGPDVERAWEQVEKVYVHHPDFVTRKTTLYSAILSLAERAWNAREAELQQQQPRGTAVPVPDFISVVRSRRQRQHTREAEVSEERGPPSIEHGTVAPQLIEGDHSLGSSNLDNLYLTDGAGIEFSPIDWAAWDEVIRDFELNYGSQV